jgi:DMSO reductase family type II enzyme heme b subunit
MRERLPGYDRRAARIATVFAVGLVVLLVAVQGAIASIATGGTQPLAQTDQLPQTASGDAWSEAPERTVSLQKQQMAVPYGGGTVDEMTVQALTNDSHVGFRLTWDDPTNDTSLTSPENFSDAAAIMLHSGEQPPITMGAAGEPVNIWYWRSNWQYGDSGAEWTGDMYSYPHPDNETRPGDAAGNPLSQDEYDQYGQNYYAKGYGSLSDAPAQNVDAHATRQDDQWSVAFVRERGTDGEYDATFGEDTMYLAFAVWNGSADEVNGQKSLTLQYSTLEQGQLSPPESGGDGGSSGGDGGDGSAATEGGSSGSSSGGGLPQPMGYIGGVVAAMIVSWTIIYWRAAE